MMRSALRNIGLSLASLAICLLTAEAVFRIIGAGPKVRSWKDRPLYYYLPAGARSLRGLDLPEAADPTVFRLAVFGDSFSFAPYMQFDDAFPRRLERMLNLNGSAQKSEAAGASGEKLSAEVYNYGVPGYSTKHEAAELKKILEEQRPDLVLLQITLNDPEIKQLTPHGMQVLTNPYGESSYLGADSALVQNWKTLAFVLQKLHSISARRAYQNYYFDLYANKVAISEYEQSLQEIAALCSEKGVPLVAVVFPLFGYPLNDDYPFKEIHGYIHGRLDQEKIPYLDLLEAFRDAPAERIAVIPGEDYHPNEIGHRIAAEEIYAWLSKGDRIPANLKITGMFSERTQIKIIQALKIEQSPPTRTSR